MTVVTNANLIAIFNFSINLLQLFLIINCK